MPSLQARIAFCRAHYTTPDGQPWSLEGRQWILDEMWRPLDGWKLWPEDKSQLCGSCARLANTIVDDYHAPDKTRTKKHRDLGCAGLRSEPILIVISNLKRQAGKTFNAAAWALTTAVMGERESIALLAGSEDQVARLFAACYQRPIKADKKLSMLCRVMGPRVIIDKRGSDIEILPTTLTSIGDTRTAVIIDECREVPAQIGPALFATMLARGGWECPTRMRSHVRTHKGVEDIDAPAKCEVCGAATQPWFGKSMFLSSAGELKDSDDDWFFELKEHFAANPHPNVHVFSSCENLNPKSSQKVSRVLSEVFGAVDSTRTAAGVESGNEFLRKGQNFMSQADVKRCVNTLATNHERSERRCVGYLDTSDTIEKTSLNIFEEDEGCKSWERIVQVRLDVWIPAELPGHVVDVIDVEKHLRSILTRFCKRADRAGLEMFFIDTRGSKQWGEMQRRLSSDFPIARRWVSNKGESEDGWDYLYQRMMARPSPRITLQDNREQMREFSGSRWKVGQKDERPKVIDRDRRKIHRDITEGVAMCCYLADLQARRGNQLGLARLREMQISRSRVSAIDLIREHDNSNTTASRAKVAEFRDREKSGGRGRAGGQTFGGPESY